MYLSPATQNEFIDVLARTVRGSILKRIRKAKYFYILLDSTPDNSHKDQTSQIIRYVTLDNGEVKVEESFIDFLETGGKDAESISTTILKKLENDGLNIEDCRGQAYDNAAVMKGQHSGVQARILEINKNALFVNCTNHSLNLAGQHAASESMNSVEFFGVLESLFAFFSRSTHRWDVLKSLGCKVKRLVETRWSARGDAVSATYEHFEGIVRALERLTGEEEDLNTRWKAAASLKGLQSFPFLCFLGMWNSVLREIDDTQKYLQIKGLALGCCDKKLHSLQKILEINQDITLDEAISYAKDICTRLDISTDPPRCGRRRIDTTASNSEETYLPYEAQVRAEMSRSAQKVIEEMTLRFQRFHEIATKFAFLEPQHLLAEKFDFVVEHDDIDSREFLIERERLRHFCAVAAAEASETEPSKPYDLLDFIVKHELVESVPNIVILLRIFLTIAVSVASCERSFSKLKLIKTHLRSTMTTSRLTNLAI